MVFYNNANKKYYPREKILKIQKDKYGYSYVNLYKNGKMKHTTIHRLVAEVFIPNPENKLEINHKNENKEDNRVENLEWCTNLYNIQYSQTKKVEQYDLQGTFIKEWNCIREVERKLKINASNISGCCKGKYGCKTAGGYIWRYKDTQ